MNYEQLAFFNRQLSGMLQSGIPLEGALKRLTAEMQRGPLRDEMDELEKDLAGGKPLEEALAARQLPLFYVGMLRVGARSDDLPGALTLVADHYSRMNAAWVRLKGLMTYPLIVLSLALGLSFLVAFVGRLFLQESGWGDLGAAFGSDTSFSSELMLAAWFPPLALALLLAGAIAVVFVPALRAYFRWRLPGFKEASVAQLASSLGMLLRSGVPLSDAVELVRSLETNQAIRAELLTWKQRLEVGRTKFGELVSGSRIVPPLFVWLVANAGEDLGVGLARAGELFHSRAIHRTEMILYCALPVSVLVLGAMILGQAVPLLQFFLKMMRLLSGVGSM